VVGAANSMRPLPPQAGWLEKAFSEVVCRPFGLTQGRPSGTHIRLARGSRAFYVARVSACPVQHCQKAVRFKGLAPDQDGLNTRENDVRSNQDRRQTIQGCRQ
jgi:hypothetical protein